MPRRPLYLVGTHQNAGKTTLSIGLVHAFRRRGLRVAYAKPLGQRPSEVDGRLYDSDALVVGRVLGPEPTDRRGLAVALPPGRVEREVFDLHTEDLLVKVRAVCAPLVETCDVVVVESMGHVAAGACLGLSSAEIARAIDARALLVTGGGIGRTIDDLALCATYLTARGADLMGVVVNKVWRNKYDRVKEALERGLHNLGLRCFGVVPYEEALSCPTMRQVHALLGGEKGLDNYVERTVIGAMESSHMVRYLARGTLLITPGDRSDNILAALSRHMLAGPDRPDLSGMVLTGGFRPDETLLDMIRAAGLPVILVPEDTYTVASVFRQTVFKMAPDDARKIESAAGMVSDYVDITGLLDALSG